MSPLADEGTRAVFTISAFTVGGFVLACVYEAHAAVARWRERHRTETITTHRAAIAAVPPYDWQAEESWDDVIQRWLKEQTP